MNDNEERVNTQMTDHMAELAAAQRELRIFRILLAALRAAERQYDFKLSDADAEAVYMYVMTAIAEAEEIVRGRRCWTEEDFAARAEAPDGASAALYEPEEDPTEEDTNG